MKTFPPLTQKIQSLDPSFENLTLEKKDLASKIIKKAPRPRIDLDLQKRLDALQKDGNKSNDNNNNGAPIPPQYLPTFNNFIPPPPPPPSLNSFQRNFQAPPPPLPSPPLSPLP